MTRSDMTEPDDWLTEGACKEFNPDVFFPTRGGDVKKAQRICATCPVQDPCRDHGLHRESFGIWGGLSERGREQERRRLNITLVSYDSPSKSWSKAKCGTPGGYKRHDREDTPPCGPCKRAQADRMADYRDRVRQEGKAS